MPSSSSSSTDFFAPSSRELFEPSLDFFPSSFESFASEPFASSPVCLLASRAGGSTSRQPALSTTVPRVMKRSPSARVTTVVRSSSASGKKAARKRRAMRS